MTQDVKFVDMMSEYSLEINEEIQRPFEWDSNKVNSFLNGILESSKKFFENKDEGSSLINFGLATTYKRDPNTSTNLYLDDSGHRCEFSVVSISALLYTVNRYGIEPEVSRSYPILCGLIDDAKKNFIPHPSDADDVKKILNGEDFEKGKRLNCLQNGFVIAKAFFDSVYHECKQDLLNLCEFFAKHYCFALSKNEYCSMEVRKMKYNQMNNINQEQNEIHRAISTLSQDAYSLGVDGFMAKVAEAKVKFNEHFPQTKKELKNNNPLIKQYFVLKILAELGYLIGEGKLSIKLMELVDKIIMDKKEKRIAFYNSLFDDVDLFCTLASGKLGFGMPSSKSNNVKMFTVASFSNVFSDKGKARYYIGSIYLRIAKNTLKIVGNNIVGINEGFTEWKVWNLLRLMYLFRFYSMSTVVRGGDERSAVAPIVIKYGEIVNDADLDKYIDFFSKKVECALNEYTYKTTRFEGYTYHSKYTEFMLFVVGGNDSNMIELLREAARKYMCRVDYNVDHIVMKGSTEDEAIKRKLDMMGNLRILEGYINKKDNMPTNTRMIGLNDFSFPESMRGKEFSADMIEERQQWISDKIRSVNKFVYDFDFEKQK